MRLQDFIDAEKAIGDIAKTPNEKDDDPVNHPKHYTDGNIETIDYIEDKNLNFHLGNAVKYISRAGKKDKDKTVEDLRKAAWYIERYIKKYNKGSDI